MGQLPTKTREIAAQRQALGGDRAGFGRIEGDVELVKIEPDWTVPGMVSIAGRHRFDDYGNIRASALWRAAGDG